MYGHIWPCMAMYGHAWPDMAIISLERHSKARNLYKINETPKSKTSFRCAKLRKNPETKVSRFLAFYPLIWAFQTLSRISNDGVWRDLSFDIKNSWFHALWLGIQSYLCLDPWEYMEIHGNPCRITRSTLQNLICYRMSVSRASGTPCGSVFGRFCVSRCQIGVNLG